MKIVKRIIIATIIGAIIQNLIFLYIEKIYLVNRSDYSIQKVDSNEAADNLEINISEGAEDIRASYDGRYISYMINNNLEIYNTKDGSKNIYKEVIGKLACYEWLTDCNKMIVIEKIIKGGTQYFVPISYDGKSSEASEITDFDMNEIKIKCGSSQSKVDKVAFSTASSSLYIKVENENGKSDLYYANQMNQLEKVKSEASIGNIVVPITSTNAVIEMENKISILNGSNNITIPNVPNPKILGTDKNNKVFFCNDNNGKTDIIYYADITEENYKWSRLKLKTEEKISDIYIDYSGKVYINYPSENKIKDVKDNKEYEYEGEFLQTYSEGIVTKDKNKIIKKILGK